MMNNTQQHATEVAMNEKESATCNEAKRFSANDNGASRSFSASDLWSIRRNARSLKIHNRIPRL